MFAGLPTIRGAQRSGERGTAQAPPSQVEMGRLEGGSLFDPACEPEALVDTLGSPKGISGIPVHLPMEDTRTPNPPQTQLWARHATAVKSAGAYTCL